MRHRHIEACYTDRGLIFSYPTNSLTEKQREYGAAAQHRLSGDRIRDVYLLHTMIFPD
jgi:hypothetical protein